MWYLPTSMHVFDSKIRIYMNSNFTILSNEQTKSNSARNRATPETTAPSLRYKQILPLSEFVNFIVSSKTLQAIRNFG